MKELTGHIKQKALDLGFSKVGIARAEQLQEEGPRLNEWLRRGFHATMHWMNRKSAERVDPCLILHDVKSIVSVAMNYYTDFRHSEKAEAGKISRYAWGNDYHVLLKKRLEQLLSFITSMAPQAQGKIYIDTGPVMEKAWAGRSGIGWIGKHANLITKDYGSWVFLGEILLNLELEYDEPATDHCGSCTRCIDACPTLAIVEPYVLDSNRCISYLTIEHRGEIAKELGERFDRWIYGCDICQDVCPWNYKFSRRTTIEAFHPEADNLAPSLAKWAEITPAEFTMRFSKSPIKRTKHSGLTRNVKLVSESIKRTSSNRRPARDI